MQIEPPQLPDETPLMRMRGLRHALAISSALYVLIFAMVRIVWKLFL